jgi:hypothetical protein
MLSLDHPLKSSFFPEKTSAHYSFTNKTSIMRKAIIPLLVAGFLFSCGEQKSAEKPMVKDASNAESNTNAKSQPSEFADPKYMDMGKSMMKQFADGNLDAWAETLADNVVYLYSSGDSLVGKKAVVDYWKDRRAKLVKSIEMTNDIWLPIKVNQPQKGPDMPGVWLLNWAQVKAAYKNGKTLQFWIHQDIHYNDQNKADRIVMYMDRAPVNAALNTK